MVTLQAQPEAAGLLGRPRRLRNLDGKIRLIEPETLLNHRLDVISEFEGERRAAKSISRALNRLIKKELTVRGWDPGFC